ncbi:MAG: tetratricopeptide repeat protein, partial [Burkholderiaceae bacterium]|nr:tetratricopeptide repeat protein [Burkholderiaceae bacterium]
MNSNGKKAMAARLAPLPLKKHATELSQIDRTRLVMLYESGKYQELENQATMLAGRHPESGFLWKALGFALLAQNKDAVSALKKATSLMPADPQTHNDLGVALLDSRRPDAAKKSFLDALALNPNYAEAHNNLGNALLVLNQLA